MRVFNEEQRFTQTWLIVLLTVSMMVPLFLIMKEYINGNMRAVELVMVLAIMATAIFPIFFFRLITKIDEQGIHYRFFPFHRSVKTIAWNEIKSASVRTYDPISEYGGWGLKGGFFSKKGKAINVKGDIGIQLVLTNSKKLLIGTQKKTEATQVLETYQHKLSTDEVD